MRVVLAMSGGVDSSVAAALLKRQGHEVVGLFMRHGAALETACAVTAPEAPPLLPIIPARSTRKQGCCSETDAADARRVADLLDIPFYALNFEEEFERIVDYFVDEYTSGRTPNPCVACNNWLKFGRLCDYADSIGADRIATGHYARLTETGDSAAPVALVRGVDPSKDQSYVLFGVARELLPRLMFPVGDFNKGEIRAMAGELGMRVADKPDSQEICFVPDGDYAAFVRRRSEGDRSGEIVTTAGKVVGRHEGVENFTIGQRKGLGVAFGEPRYVVRIEPESRRVVVGERSALSRDRFSASRCNWLAPAPAEAFSCHVKIRYLAAPVAARVEPLGDDRVSVCLEAPQQGIAPGQAVVCYAGDRVLGGGWIE